MKAFDFIVATLALWRVSSLLVRERGPADVFLRVRQAAGIEHGDGWAPMAWPDTWASNVLSCVRCLSVNLAAALALLWWRWPRATRAACIPLALSAGAILVEEMTNGPSYH